MTPNETLRAKALAGVSTEGPTSVELLVDYVRLDVLDNQDGASKIGYGTSNVATTLNNIVVDATTQTTSINSLFNTTEDIQDTLTQVTTKLDDFVSVKDFGAKGDGITDDSAALEAFWQAVRDSRVNYDVTSLDWVTTKYVIPPGKYRVTRSVNWSNLLVRNVHVEAEGALIVAEVSNKPVIDMIGSRGIHLDGLAIQTAAGYTAQSAILMGPTGTAANGNIRMSNVKAAGFYSIAACHNVGSETSMFDFCYWQNKLGTGYAYAADGSHSMGATSDYIALRTPGTPVSFTSNIFSGNTFANLATSGNAVYLEGTTGWSFDKMCYWLSFDNATVVARQIGTIRNSSLKLAGLFETAHGIGLKHVVKFVIDDGAFTSCNGFELDAATPNANTSIIRVETPSGAEMTSGAFGLTSAQIKLDGIWPGTPTTLFSGARMSFSGELRVRPSAAINLTNLVGMHGVIYTSDATLITRGAASAQHSFLVVDDTTLAGQGTQFAGAGTGSVGFQPGTIPRVRALGSGADYDLWLSGQGAGQVRFGTLTTNADAPVTGYITIKDSLGTVRKLAVIT